MVLKIQTSQWQVTQRLWFLRLICRWSGCRNTWTASSGCVSSRAAHLWYLCLSRSSLFPRAAGRVRLQQVRLLQWVCRLCPAAHQRSSPRSHLDFTSDKAAYRSTVQEDCVYQSASVQRFSRRCGDWLREREGHTLWYSSPSRLPSLFAELMGLRHCVTAAEIPDQKPTWCLDPTQETNPIRKLIVMQRTHCWSGTSLTLPQCAFL